MNIILIGFMGCGKSTIGVRLSYRMKQPYIDTDKYIESMEESSVSELFAQRGEEAFRDTETEVLRSFVDKRLKNHVVATGGGMPLRPENMRLMKALGPVVWLKITPEGVYERLKTDTTRPLLQVPEPLVKIKELMSVRESAYRDCADIAIDVENKTPERIMDEIFTGVGGIWKKRKKELYRI